MELPEGTFHGGLHCRKQPDQLDESRDTARSSPVEAQQVVDELNQRLNDKCTELQRLAVARNAAMERVGDITKRQLSEIRQLSRNPPDAIRRVLAAAWLLLHCDSFPRDAAVRFDEVKDFPRCQRMLNDQ